MAKGKLSTPDWIREGYDSKADWEKAQGKKSSSKKSGKTFKIKVCPECGGEVGVVLGNEEGKGTGEWQCKKCKWKGRDVDEKELSEDEFLEYLDKIGENEKK